MAEERTIMLRMFEQKAKPTMYLASDAQVQKTLANEFEIDIVRGNETFAVDVTPGAGSRSNKKSRYTTKTYNAPAYNESYPVTAEELNKRLPGQTKYEAAGDAYSTTLAAYMSDKQILMQEKIVRAIELQARDAYFDGKIVTHNGDEIDFKKKATHNVTPSAKWSAATGAPLDDLEAACQLIRKDALISTTRFRLTVADDVVEALKANDQFVEKANLRHVQNIDMGMPTDVNTDGATFHGIFSCGSYIIELWAYPQFYDVPTGFGLANEGTKQPYIPSGKSLLKPAAGSRYDLIFGGVPVVSDQVDPRLTSMGLTGTLNLAETDFYPYARLDRRAECIEVGVKSRPLFIPHDIDSFVTFDTLV